MQFGRDIVKKIRQEEREVLIGKDSLILGKAKGCLCRLYNRPRKRKIPFLCFIHRIEKQLALYENCAIRHEAPEIVGRDTLGNIVRLSDFRGNDVMVDFWNSYCHWCWEETPVLKKALERFGGKNFKILGVSSDMYKDKWIEAIHEDGSYWDHLMLEKGNDVMDRYCIKGIPHIILVAPDGTILAKELCGEDLVKVPEKLMN